MAKDGFNTLEEMMKKQSINFKAFMSTVSSIHIDQFENQWQFEKALEALDGRWRVIDDLHWEIEGETNTDNDPYQDQFTEYEHIYNKLTDSLNSKKCSVSYREKSTPQITIPVFNGDYHQWVSFKDLFVEAIDKNPSMSRAQKMQLLKVSVSGEPERLIHHLQICSENYQICWEILNHRYGNTKLIFTSHVDMLLGLPSMQQQSLEMIKQLHDMTKECLHTIQNLGVDISTWDPLLVHLLSRKLDGVSFQQYIQSLKKPRELPSLQEFLDFLETKFTTLEASHRKPNQQTMQPQVPKTYHQNHTNLQQFPEKNCNNWNVNMSTFHLSRSFVCALCNADHGIWRCNTFLQMTHEQRLRKVEQLNYCFNCLIDHSQKPCSSTKRCRKCLGKHNSLLHDALVAKQSPPMTAKPTYRSPRGIATEKVTKSSHASRDENSEMYFSCCHSKDHGRKRNSPSSSSVNRQNQMSRLSVKKWVATKPQFRLHQSHTLDYQPPEYRMTPQPHKTLCSGSHRQDSVPFPPWLSRKPNHFQNHFRNIRNVSEKNHYLYYGRGEINHHNH